MLLPFFLKTGVNDKSAYVRISPFYCYSQSSLFTSTRNTHNYKRWELSYYLFSTLYPHRCLATLREWANHRDDHYQFSSLPSSLTNRVKQKWLTNETNFSLFFPSLFIKIETIKELLNSEEWQLKLFFDPLICMFPFSTFFCSWFAPLSSWFSYLWKFCMLILSHKSLNMYLCVDQSDLLPI